MLIDGPATAASGAAIEQVGEGTDHAIWVGVPGNWLSLGGRAIGGGGGQSSTERGRRLVRAVA